LIEPPRDQIAERSCFSTLAGEAPSAGCFQIINPASRHFHHVQSAVNASQPPNLTLLVQKW